MKLKQTIIIVAAAFGLSIGLSGLLLEGDAAFAQVPAMCENLGGQDREDCIQANTTNDNDGAQDCAGVRTSILSGDFCDEEEEGGVIFGLLKWVLRIMTAGVGIAAVGGIAYGALLYTTAENKPEQTKKAIGVITNVVIGLVAYALMFVFLNFLIPGGIFT